MRRGRRGSGLGIAAVVALVVLLAPSSAFGQGTTWRVTKTADETDGLCTATDCALRVALENAADTDTVVVPAGTYVLTIGQPLPLFQNVTVTGAGARSTIINAANTSRVLNVASAVTASMSGVTLTGGNGAEGQNPGQGGAVRVPVGSQLTLANSTVAGNTVSGSTATTGHGGGIYNAGRLFLLASTVSGNQASQNGGGIYQTGNEIGLFVTTSTISGNTAGTSGGGIYSAGVLGIGRSTIAGNSAPAGGGLYKGFGGATITDTIIAAGSLGGACGNVVSVTSTYNLSSDTSCPFTGTGDRVNVGPALGPLRDNGGPTNTHALLAGSPAIGAANPDPQQCTSTDQRGVARPQQGTCDIGAFEYVPPLTPPPPPPPTQELPPPEAGKTVNALPKSGTVRVKLPGRKRYRRLREGEQLPVGTIFDTRKGHVTLVAAADKKGGTATSEFWAGIFKLRQTKGARPITELRLIEKLRCPKAGKATTSAKRKKKRRLWGNGKGRFRTKGKYSAATVRGTKWLVEDRCGSTLTRVVRGRVAVRDFVKKKTVIVRAKKRYIARKRK